MKFLIKNQLIRLLCVALLCFTAISSFAQSVSLSSTSTGDVNVGMPGVPFIVSVVNKGSGLNNCVLRIYQQAGMIITNPTATVYKNNGTSVSNAVSYNENTKQFTFLNPLDAKDSMVISYTGVASGEAIALGNNVRNDSLIFTSGSYRLAQLSNPPYKVVWAEFSTRPQNLTKVATWQSQFTDSMTISNQGMGATDAFYVYVSGINSTINLDKAYISSKEHPGTRIQLASPTLSAGVYRFSIAASDLNKLGYADKGFVQNSEINFYVVYKATTNITAMQISYNVKWNAKTNTGAEYLISRDNTLRYFTIPTIDRPNIKPIIKSVFKIIKHPSMCDGLGIAEYIVSVPENSSPDTLDYTAYNLIPKIYTEGLKMEFDSVKIANTKLLFSKNGNITSFQMPSVLPTDSVRNLGNYDGQTPIEYNDIKPGGFVKFTIYFTYPDQKNNLFNGDYRRILAEWGTQISSINHTSYTIYIGPDFWDTDPTLSMDPSGVRYFSVGNTRDFALAMPTTASIYGNKQDILSCNSPKVLLICKVPQGFSRPVFTANAYNKNILQQSIVAQADGSWLISVLSSDAINGDGLLGGNALLKLTPTCAVTGLNNIHWDMYYQCNSCQSADSLNLRTIGTATSLRHIGTADWKFTVIPDSTCLTENTGFSAIIPRLSIQRTNFGYYNANKSGHLDSIWHKSDITSPNTQHIVRGDALYNSLLAAGEINPKLALTLDTTVTSLSAKLQFDALTSIPDTIVAEFTYQSNKKIFDIINAVVSISGTSSPIDFTKSQILSQEPTSGNGQYTYRIKIPKSMLTGGEFVSGNITTELYAKIKDDATVAKSPLLLDIYSGNYQAVYADKSVLTSVSVGDTAQFTICKPSAISIRYDIKESSYGCNAAYSANIVSPQPYSSANTNSNALYQMFNKEFRSIVELKSIALDTISGFDLYNFSGNRGFGSIATPAISRDGYRKIVSDKFPIGSQLDGFEISFNFKMLCGANSTKGYIYRNASCSATINNYVNSPQVTSASAQTWFYIPANVNIKTIDYISIGRDKKTSWPLTIYGPDYNSHNNWIRFTSSKNKAAKISITKVKDINGSLLPILKNISEDTIYVNIGQISNMTSNFIVEAQYNNCLAEGEKDSVQVSTGWSCGSTISDICWEKGDKTNEIMYHQQSSWQHTDSLTVNKHFNSCENIGVDLSIKSTGAQGVPIKNLGFWFVEKDSLLELVDNSLTYTYGTVGGKINANLFTPDNRNISAALETNNQLKDSIPADGKLINMHFDLKLHCAEKGIPDLMDVGRLVFNSQAYSACGSPLASTPSVYNLLFKGFEMADKLFMTVKANSFNKAKGQTTVDLHLKNLNGVFVNGVYVEVLLPKGISYLSGSLANPYIADTLGSTMYRWKIDMPDSMNISFNIKDNSTCSPDSILIPIRAYIVNSLDGCTGTCQFQKSFIKEKLIIQIPTSKPEAIAGDTVVCQGRNSLKFSSYNKNNTQFTWSISPVSAGEISILSKDSAKVDFNPAFSGFAVLTVTGEKDSCALTPQQSKTIHVLPAVPVSILGLDSVYCLSNKAIILVGKPAGGVFVGDTTVLKGAVFNPNKIGSYTVQYVLSSQDAGTCPAIASMQVRVLSAAVVKTTNPLSVCSPSTVNISDTALVKGSSEGLTYTYWNDALATKAVSLPSAVSISGTYYIKGTNAAGCSDIQPVEVTINESPLIEIAADSVSLCKGKSVTLVAKGAQSYVWDNSLPAQASQTVSPTQTTTYHVAGTDGNGCQGSSEITINVEECVKPCTVTANNDTTICAGTPVILRAKPSNCLVGNLGCSAKVESPYACSDSPISAYDQNLTIASGKTVYVSNFSGNIQMNGGTLVICGSNSVLPYLNINGSTASTIVINGTARFQNINVNHTNLTVKNYGSLIFDNYTCNSAIENYGTMTLNADFEIKKSLMNAGAIIAKYSFNNSSLIDNKGTISVGNVLHNNGPGTLLNSCTITAYQFINDNICTNSGVIKVSTSTILNGSETYNAKAGSLLETKSFGLDGKIVGDATQCSTIKLSTINYVNGSANISGKINVCGISTSSSSYLNSKVTYGCSCSMSGAVGLQYEWTPAADLDDASLASPTVLNPTSTKTYTVKVTDANGVVATDEITLTVVSCSKVTVSPNPFTTYLDVYAKTATTGTASVKLYKANGSSVTSKTINTNGTQRISLSSSLAVGNYTLVVTTKEYTETVNLIKK